MVRRLLPLLLVFVSSFAAAQQPYDIGSPVLRDLWVDPVSGSDSNSGATRAQALRTLSAAWELIPRGSVLKGTGYRIQLTAGLHPRPNIPVYLESRYGTFAFPIIFNSADGPHAARLGGDLNIFDTRYLYLIGLDITPDPPGDVVHCELCDHFLVRDCALDGGNRIAQETLKANQSQYFYVESSDIHGAFDNAIDFVAVQYGQVLNNRIHDAQDWCEYAKGGSAYLRIEGNEYYDCGTGGFTAGQGSGFQFLSAPWIHYEAYDIKVVNNVIHDTEGAGLGVNGGYDILLAHNTLYRVGSRSHMLELVFGLRSCDGVPGDAGRERCQQYLDAGGWGTTIVDDGTNEVNIPNRNIYVYDNILYNPAGFVSPQHFNIAAPRTNAAGSGAPSPALADDGVRIRGNIIFNGNPSTPLGLGDESGCPSANATCNESQLRADNAINVFEPQLVNPAGGDFRLTAQSNVFGPMTFALPSFSWSDAPTRPAVPQGTLTNVVATDRAGVARTGTPVAGAYASSISSPSPRRRGARH